MNGSPELIDYALRREAQERAAAKRAMTPAARGCHQELAQLYCDLRLGARRDWRD